MTAVTLAPESVEAVARRVADLLRGEDVGGELIDTAKTARRFGVSRDYLYAHADDLGAVRLGDGPKARLRFNPAKVAEALAAAEPAPATPRRRRRRRPGDRASVELLPVAEEVRS